MIHRVTQGGRSRRGWSDPSFWDPVGRFEFKATAKSVEQCPILPVLAANMYGIRPVPIVNSSFPFELAGFDKAGAHVWDADSK
jgi:hypothetical protein